MIVTSLLGFVYWWLAARLFLPEAVGLASAATSAMMLISSFCLLGLGTLLITEIPRNKGQEGPYISTALLTVGGTGFVVGVGFALLAPLISPSFRPLGANVENIVLFAAGVSAAAVTVIADQVVIALLKGGLQFWRNALFSSAKLALLYLASRWLADRVGLSIYNAWTLSSFLSLVPLLLLAVWKNRRCLNSFLPRWDLPRKLGAAAFQHHILNLILQAPTQLLPLFVTVLLSAKANAWFYVASMIANFIFSISLSLTTVLHATNAAQRATLSQKTRLTVLLAMITSAAASLVLLPGAGPLLNFFGHDYAAQAALPLRILVLGAFPSTIINHYIAIRRIKDEITNAMIPIILSSLLELGVAALGARLGGLTGLSLGWVVALCIEALFMLPLVYRTITGTEPASDAISSIINADTMILTTVRPAITDPRGRIVEAPTLKMSAFVGLTSSLDSIKSLALVDAPTMKMEPVLPEEQPTTGTLRAIDVQLAAKFSRAIAEQSAAQASENGEQKAQAPVGEPPAEEPVAPQVTQKAAGISGRSTATNIPVLRVKRLRKTAHVQPRRDGTRERGD